MRSASCQRFNLGAPKASGQFGKNQFGHKNELLPACAASTMLFANRIT
jgi:hypothetical protein